MSQTDAQTQINVLSLIEKKSNLQAPALPVDFVEEVMVIEPADFLLQWLDDHKVPIEVRMLFNLILFAELYRANFFEHGGQVPEDINEVAIENLGEAVNLMGKLGYTW